MLEIIKPGVNINFIRMRKVAFSFSALLIVAGLLSLVSKGGPNYGIDFTGGLMLHVGVDPAVEISEVRRAVSGLQVGEISVQEFGSQPGEFLLRIPTGEDQVAGGRAARIKTALREAFEGRGFEEKRTEIVGPRVGKELRRRGILSVLFATVMMGAYIAIRFDVRFGIGAALALAHDVLITLGALSLANVEINLSVVAALLTVVGYSVNDTVVVSDRIRENLKRLRHQELGSLINRSINETLSRTILTTGTSLMVLFSLFFFGGGVIHSFAFTLLVGLTAGTYSSIFIASPVVEYWKRGKLGF
ncbi:MAG: protein translocase subunit SecF [Deltaproteobacteria bacterium]